MKKKNKMPLNLVNYSSSSSDEEISAETQNKKKNEKISSVENSRRFEMRIKTLVFLQ